MVEEVLRCGRCWRDLATEWGRKLHVVYGDGSMRCMAPEGRRGVIDTHMRTELEYTSTYVVLDTDERRNRLAEVVTDG